MFLCISCQVKCVVVGFDIHFNYVKLYTAQQYLKDPDCLFIATNTDSALPAGSGAILPGEYYMIYFFIDWSSLFSNHAIYLRDWFHCIMRWICCWQKSNCVWQAPSATWRHPYSTAWHQPTKNHHDWRQVMNIHYVYTLKWLTYSAICIIPIFLAQIFRKSSKKFYMHFSVLSRHVT